MIENRLRQSSRSIKEISYEMGFTDMSHFNKFFHKYKGVSPREYRLQYEAARHPMEV
jgi:AraC-like DNA-binding protein